MERFQPRQQLWIFGSSLLVRLIWLVGGILLWGMNHTIETSLKGIALVIAFSSLLGLVLDSSPFWDSDGYAWLLTFFQLPQLLPRSFQFWKMLLQGKPLPHLLGNKERFFLTCFGILSGILSLLALATLILIIGLGLARYLDGLLGDAAYFLLPSLLAIPVLRHLMIQFNRYWF
jgi:hypothetical protein